MRVVGRDKLDAFVRKHADALKWIENWLADAENAVWANPDDIKNAYASASFLGNRVVVFNVKGNKYRLETQIAYQIGVVAVFWTGTHA